MATTFWTFKAPSTHAEELAMRQDAAAEFREAQANERARQLRKEQDERDHEAWKRQLLRDRNVTIHASTAAKDDGIGAAVVTYAVLSNVSASSYSACDASPSDSSSCDSSSSSSSDSNSGGGSD